MESVITPEAIEQIKAYLVAAIMIIGLLLVMDHLLGQPEKDDKDERR